MVPGLGGCPINAVSSILFLAFSYPLSLETWPYLSDPLSPSGLDQRLAMWVRRARGQCTLLGTLTAPTIISSSNSGALTPLLLCTLALPVLEIGALPSPLATENGQWSYGPFPWQQYGWLLPSLLPPHPWPSLALSRP